jgi:hypothetical protein
MAKIFGATFILVLFLVAFFNGYSVEGAGIGDQLEKENDDIHKYMKSWKLLDCDTLAKLCFEFPLLNYCYQYRLYCPPKPQNFS